MAAMDTLTDLLAHYRSMKALLAQLHDQAERLESAECAHKVAELNGLLDQVLLQIHEETN